MYVIVKKKETEIIYYDRHYIWNVSIKKSHICKCNQHAAYFE